MKKLPDKIDVLRNISILSNLREYELDILAGYSEYISAGKGSPIFATGEESDCFYVVVRGQAGIVHIKHELQDVTVAKIVPGESLGELDFFEAQDRSATAFAERDSVFLRFPSRNRSKDDILKKNPYIFALIYYKVIEIVANRIADAKENLYGKTEWLIDLHKQLLCDKLTGLYNSIYLKEDFLNMLPAHTNSAALVMIKPDNFKPINDRYGHEAGDKTLRLMAIFLQSELDEHDIGIRYHGDEFAALLLNKNKKNVLQKVKDISLTYRRLDLSGIIDEELTITVSIGISMYPDEYAESGSLVKRCYERMMKARALGGNRIVCGKSGRGGDRK